MIKILTIGAAGQLGRAIHDYCEEINSSEIELIETDVVEGYDCLDANDTSELTKFIDKNSIDFIINCAAYTNVGKAENDFENCYKLNVSMVESISNAIENSISRPFLFHISTDYVYNGHNHKPFKEEESGNACGVYGMTKLLGERKIKVNSIIFRTSWLYYSGNTSFISKIIKNLENKHEVPVVSNQIGTPTYAYDLAKAIIDILLDYKGDIDVMSGIYNFSNLGVCSWYDFAKEIERLTYKTNKVVPIELVDNIRPYYSVMSKLEFMFAFPKISIPHWRDSLEKFIEEKL